MRPIRLTVGDVELHGVAVGEGPPVMAAHGAPGLLDHGYLRRALEPLDLPVRWILWDHRGSGRSGQGRLEEITHRRLVDDLEALRQGLGLGPAILLGHSYGGFFVLEHALRHPARASALILCNTAPSHRFFHEYLAHVRRYVPQEAWDRLMDASLAGPRPERVGDLIAVLAPLLFAREREGEVRRLLGASVPRPAVAIHLARQTRKTYDLEGSLSRVACPTLVLGGLHDRICAPRFSEAMARAIPGAELVLFEESGHMPMVEEPERFTQVVRAFLETHGLLGPGAATGGRGKGSDPPPGRPGLPRRPGEAPLARG